MVVRESDTYYTHFSSTIPSALSDAGGRSFFRAGQVWRSNRSLNKGGRCYKPSLLRRSVFLANVNSTGGPRTVLLSGLFGSVKSAI